MKLKYNILLIGFIAAMSAYFISFFGFIIGGLVVGYLIKDNYNDAVINGAIAGLSAGVLVDIIFVISNTSYFIDNHGVAIAAAVIFMIGNVVGGISGIGGIIVREQIEK